MSMRVRPGQALTVREFMELDYDPDAVRYELQEGNLVFKSSPRPEHQYAVGEHFVQLRAQVPPGNVVLLDTDVNLELAPEDGPGTVRKPDLFVVQAHEYQRVVADGGMIRASQVILAIEVLSSASMRTDRMIKYMEYRDAGIGHYWIVDLDPPISVRPFHLAGAFGYQPSASETEGVYRASEPLSVVVGLEALRYAG